MIGKKVRDMLSRQKERKRDRSSHTEEEEHIEDLNNEHGCFICQNKVMRKLTDTSISSYDNDPDIVGGIEAMLNCFESILFCPINYGLYCMDVNDCRESEFADDETTSSASFLTSKQEAPATAPTGSTTARVASF